MNQENDDASGAVSRGLMVALIIGAIAFLGFVVWILRTGGSIWG